MFEGLFTVRYREILWGGGRGEGFYQSTGGVGGGLLVVLGWNCQLAVGHAGRLGVTRCPPCVAIQIARLLSPFSMWFRHRKPVEVPLSHPFMIVGSELPCITLTALVKDAKLSFHSAGPETVLRH